MGNVSAAGQALDEAARLDSESPMVWAAMALISMKAGHVQAAANALKVGRVGGAGFISELYLLENSQSKETEKKREYKEKGLHTV